MSTEVEESAAVETSKETDKDTAPEAAVEVAEETTSKNDLVSQEDANEVSGGEQKEPTGLQEPIEEQVTNNNEPEVIKGDDIQNKEDEKVEETGTTTEQQGQQEETSSEGQEETAISQETKEESENQQSTKEPSKEETGQETKEETSQEIKEETSQETKEETSQEIKEGSKEEDTKEKTTEKEAETKEETEQPKTKKEGRSSSQDKIPSIPSITLQTDLGENMSLLDVNQSKSPEEEQDEEEEEEEEEEEKEEFDRDEAIEYYKGLFTKMEKLQQTHHQLQHKIAEYLARKVESKRDGERDATDQEQRYQKCLKGLDELQQELGECQLVFENEEEKMKAFYQQKELHVSQARKDFATLIQEQSAISTNSRTGRKMNMQTVIEHIAMLEKKDEDVTQVRLENIKLQHKIHKLDTLIKQKEQLAEGLHMIDFEQLRINNADLNDKIEERNEEILKLKKKITSTIQVLAHLKEKLQFLQAENVTKKAVLKEIEKRVAKNRDLLTRLKQAKDSIRTENFTLSQQGGLVGHHKLLRDFENKQDQSEEMKLELQKLQNRHSNLILQCNTLRQRIDQTRLLQT